MITPDNMIIDAHVHLWDPEQFPIPWLRDLPSLNQVYGIESFLQQSDACLVAGMIYVEVDVAPQFALLEAQQIVALAQTYPPLRGIVAAAPLEYGAQARSYLDALAALGPMIKGVRRNLQDETDLAFFQNPDLLQGICMLAQYGFSFDICIRHHQLPAVTELVRQCPDISFILDHMAKPNIRDHMLDPWRQDIAALAAFPNVACKISGLLTEASPDWQQADLEPYIHHAITVFGSQRVMFGGDWPVMRLAGTYSQWTDMLLFIMKRLPEEVQRAFWHENAKRLYRL